MKALLWHCTLVTTLCLASQCIATNQFDNSKFSPEKYLSLKRTKPSLSIVNPLDVLRQRVVLEMARRQRESAIKQAELNREILKSIGKRGNSIDYNDVEEYLRNRYYDTARAYQPLIYQQQPQQQLTHENLAAAVAANKAEPRQQQQMIRTSQNQKATGSNGNKIETGAVNGNAANEASQSQEQLYQIFDDGSNNNNMIDDDEEMQVKYLYSLLKNRIPNSI